MTPQQERELYATDHPAWCRYIAPRWAQMLASAEPDVKREIWAKASDALKDELRRLANG